MNVPAEKCSVSFWIFQLPTIVQIPTIYDLGKTSNKQFKQSNLTLNCLNLIDSRITFKFLLGFPVLQTFWKDVESYADLNLFFSPNLLQEFEILNCNFAYTGDDNNENFPSLEPTWVQHKNFLR